MTKVIGITSGFSGLVVEIPDNDKGEASAGTEVIFKDEEGKEEYGVVKYVGRTCLDKDKVQFTSRILRKATANDIQKMENYFQQSEHALDVCRKLVANLGLEMYPFRAGYSFDGTRVHFMFTADDRVDFRDLVKDLAKKLQKKIQLRQVGPRDKAKMLGGFGKCGRDLCCTSFLGKFESINMDMVREQGLESKGSSKLSGSCGKLLCCLKYEVTAYKELRRKLPRIGQRVKVKKAALPVNNEGKVIGLDVLNQKLKLIVGDHEYVVVGAEDVDKVIAK